MDDTLVSVFFSKRHLSTDISVELSLSAPCVAFTKSVSSITYGLLPVPVMVTSDPLHEQMDDGEDSVGDSEDEDNNEVVDEVDCDGAYPSNVHFFSSNSLASVIVIIYPLSDGDVMNLNEQSVNFTVDCDEVESTTCEADVCVNDVNIQLFIVTVPFGGVLINGFIDVAVCVMDVKFEAVNSKTGVASTVSSNSSTVIRHESALSNDKADMFEFWRVSDAWREVRERRGVFSTASSSPAEPILHRVRVSVPLIVKSRGVCVLGDVRMSVSVALTVSLSATSATDACVCSLLMSLSSHSVSVSVCVSLTDSAVNKGSPSSVSVSDVK